MHGAPRQRGWGGANVVGNEREGKAKGGAASRQMALHKNEGSVTGTDGAAVAPSVGKRVLVGGASWQHTDRAGATGLNGVMSIEGSAARRALCSMYVCICHIYVCVVCSPVVVDEGGGARLELEREGARVGTGGQ